MVAHEALPWLVTPDHEGAREFLVPLVHYFFVLAGWSLAYFWLRAELAKQAEHRKAMRAQAETLRAEGASVMYLAVDGVPAGLLAVSDPIKASTMEALVQGTADGLQLLLGIMAALIVFVALVALGFGFGLWRLGQAEPVAQGAMLRLVQPNAEQSLKWDPVQADIFFRRLLDLTRAGARPDLTVWPETAVPYLLEDYPQVALAMAEAGRGAPHQRTGPAATVRPVTP